MPIRPENRARYPRDWKRISLSIRERAGGKCEWCPAQNGQPHPVTGSKVVLTVAHLDHTPENCDPDNLRALCQRCHLTYDAKHHAVNAAETRRKRMAVADMFAGADRTRAVPG
jgi:5-methylcytosine-specific restriction endonuclease McrA